MCTALEKFRNQGVEEGKREGIEEGKREGIEEGKRVGLQEGKKEVVRTGISKGYSTEVIMDLTGLTEAQVEQIREEIAKE